MRIRNPRDFWMGALFLALALVTLWQLDGLELGTAAHMGPAYMPRLVSFGLCGIAAVLFASGLRGPQMTGTAGGAGQRLSLRPVLFVTAGVVAFGLLVRLAGLVVASMVAVLIGALGSRETRFLEVLATAFAFAAFAVIVFVYALRLNLSIWPRGLF